MDKDIHSRWLTILYPLFPENASITPNCDNNEFLISASWKLNNNPLDPDLRSRTVVIEVP